MNKLNLKEGDWVKVLRKPTEEELKEWPNSWEERDAEKDAMFNMNNAIGKVHQVYRVYDNSDEVGVTLKDGLCNYNYPLCILEPVEAPQES